MRRRTLILASGVALALTAAGPVGAHPGHTSCTSFGADSAELGEAHELAPLIHSVIAEDPTAIGDVVAFEHGLFCDSK